MSVQKQLSVDRGYIVQNQGRQAVFGQLLVNGGNQITRKDTQHNIIALAGCRTVAVNAMGLYQNQIPRNQMIGLLIDLHLHLTF